MSIRALLASLLVAVCVAGTRVSAAEFVEVESGAGTSNAVRLVGYVARPPGPGPFPAVVLLHGCGGFHSPMLSWADRLSRMGYVALSLDSFGRRDIDDHCAGFFPDQAEDAYAALAWLSARPFVRASHVAVMGFSMGGGSVLTALETGALERRYAQKFRAGIAFYPLCQWASGIMTGPVLILVGAADTWTPSSSCEAMVAGRTELGAPRKPGDRSTVELVVYPGVHHGFDRLELSLIETRGVSFHGHRIEYSEAATKNAIIRVREFLQRTIGEP